MASRKPYYASAYHQANSSIPQERHYAETNKVEQCLLDLFQFRARYEFPVLFLNNFNDIKIMHMINYTLVSCIIKGWKVEMKSLYKTK